MSRILSPVTGVASTTYCTRDGTPYRTDPYGVAYVNATHVTELTTRGLAQPSASQLATAHHIGESVITAENIKDHG